MIESNNSDCKTILGNPGLDLPPASRGRSVSQTFTLRQAQGERQKIAAKKHKGATVARRALDS
jgi:hypothetical protein